MILYQGKEVSKFTGEPPRLVNIRGTNGSGKTYIVKQWMKKQSAVPYPHSGNLLGGITSKKPRYYRLQDGGWLVGRYQQNCGGCDTISSQDEVKQRVLEGYNAGAPYVLFEGLMITSSFQPWYDFSHPLGGMLWIYLDTPLDLCLDRVWKRTGHDPNLRGNVKHKHIETLQQLQKTAVCGDRVAVLHYEDYIAEFEKLMQVYQ